MANTGTYVWHEGGFIPKADFQRIKSETDGGNRSDLPSPYVMGDIQPYRSMVDGSVIGGRRQHRDHLRAHGCEEVGNEKLPAPSAPKVTPHEIGRDIKESIEQLRAGYIDPDHGPTHDSDGNWIETPDIEPIVVPANIKNGDVIRSDIAVKD